MSANLASWKMLEEINRECFPKVDELDLPDLPLSSGVAHHRPGGHKGYERRGGPRHNTSPYRKNLPLPGEMPLKEFLQTESSRLGIHVTGVFNRIKRGKYPTLHIRHHNPRVVFVRYE